MRTAMNAALGALLLTVSSQALAEVPKPAALTASNIPPVPDALAAKTRPYLEYRTAGFGGWDASDRSMLISTRFGNVSQLHRVAMPMGARQQLTFEAEPVGGSVSPTGDTIVISKDEGGSEFAQLYRWDDGQLELLTDGESRNGLGGWSEDGELIAFSSTKRTGKLGDIYVMNPRDPSSARMVYEAPGVGWFPGGFSRDKSKLLIIRYISITNMDLYSLDLASGELVPLRDPAPDEAFGGFEEAPDGTLWVTADVGSDIKRVGTLDRNDGTFTPKGDFGGWEITSIALDEEGDTLAVVTNEKGSSQLWFYDIATGEERRVDTLPPGLISSLEFAPWGPLGFTFTSARSPSDAYSIDPDSFEVTRWTKSETGGLDPELNVEPELIETASFDGEAVTGYLYRPDPAKFPGARPLIMSIHGGPESQFRPGFRGSSNYYLNELGIALFYPNVRGSSGFGKRFVALDNGPFLRENSVKDIGAFLDTLGADPAIDAERIGVTGGSYGGYMCYASAIRYKDQVDGALCNVAISNFVTFLENTQDYRRDLRRAEYGDERDPEQRAKLEEISPLNRIGEIDDPLFVIQGANDPRVPQSEADQLVERVRANGQEVWYLVGENEGHGFRKKENRDYQFWTSLMFWEKVLLAE
ncbi:S9 family peptidase [Sphingomicrobium lutaoense]|uniref:Dipeptidyl aminopeptidase/acylaminoacyl peptidase n=1 Tax=Sphingomicrobium lutaoense TaxID=515949 RepID=A0A839YVG1_9SPHN|nr:prolyl oligopeptidase family serine peptidase [Sphingomicrobium lutaoense]MBB3763026.1 dipeptidyl aminopeptidase/acylaminoacyl peptidase [Sphingomicrobium lutaoense]